MLLLMLKGQDMAEDFVDEDSDFVIGGLVLPWGTSWGRPGIWMDITEKRLVFRHRFFGRFLGPWIVERERIASVYPERGALGTHLSRVKIIEKGGTVWTFWTKRPNDVAETLQEWGYPVTGGSPSSG